MVDHVLHRGQVDCDHSAQVTAPGTPCPHSARSPGGLDLTRILHPLFYCQFWRSSYFIMGTEPSLQCFQQHLLGHYLLQCLPI